MKEPLFNLNRRINSLGKKGSLGDVLPPRAGSSNTPDLFSFMSSIPSMGRVLDSVCSFSLMLSEEGLFDLRIKTERGE